ncbi:hypothetical protein ACFL59_13160 [Planctomycetota bacterium]
MLSQDDVQKVLESYVLVKVDPRERGADRSALKYKTTRYVPEVVLLDPQGNSLGTVKSRNVAGYAQELRSALAKVRGE